MSDALQLGVWLFPADPVADLVDAVVRLDEAGIDEVWIADEGVMRDPVPVLAAAAARTSHIRLGVGITSPVLRHPGALGATWSTLDELSGGRAMLGLGLGGELSLAPFGLGFTKPVATMRTALRTARAVIRREPLSDEVAVYSSPAHAAPGRDVPLFVASKGEQINRLASREADGVFLSGFALDRLAEPVAWARSVRPVVVALYASVRFRPDPPADPTSLTGPVEEVADGLVRLAAAHRPERLGLALVDGDPVDGMVARAIEVVALVRERLAAIG